MTVRSVGSLANLATSARAASKSTGGSSSPGRQVMGCRPLSTTRWRSSGKPQAGWPIMPEK